MDRVRQEALAPVQSPLIFSLVAHIGAKRPYQAEDNVELIPMKLKSEIKWELLVLVHNYAMRGGGDFSTPQPGGWFFEPPARGVIFNPPAMEEESDFSTAPQQGG